MACPVTPSLTDVRMHQYEDIQVLTVEEAKLPRDSAKALE